MNETNSFALSPELRQRLENATGKKISHLLPSLAAEGGPPPEQLLPDAGEIAGLVSGFFASRAGLPTIPEAPRVRHIQLVQLKTVLSWAVRALDFSPLDGKVLN